MGTKQTNTHIHIHFALDQIAKDEIYYETCTIVITRGLGHRMSIFKAAVHPNCDEALIRFVR